MPSNYNYPRVNEIIRQVEGAIIETTQNQMIGYTIKEYQNMLPTKYRPLVMACWLNSLRYGNPILKLTDASAYYNYYSKHIDDVFKRVSTILRVAVMSDDDDIYLGFSVSEGETLHFIFVPKVFRNNGIGRNLFPSEIKTFTELTTIGQTIWQNKMKHLVFNPFI